MRLFDEEEGAGGCGCYVVKEAASTKKTQVAVVKNKKHE